MKHTAKILLLSIFSMLFMFLNAQENTETKTKDQRKVDKAQKKKEKEEKETADWLMYQQMAQDRRYVVEFDRVTNTKTGEQYILSRRLNFLALRNDSVVIQVQTHPYLSDNGLGGITIDGTVSNYKYVAPKNDKKPIVISFNVASKLALRGLNVRITVTKAGMTTITLGSSPNIYSYFLQPEEASINIGVNMWK